MSGQKKLHHRIFATLLALGILALLGSTAALVVNLATRTPSPTSSAVLPPTGQPLDVTTFLGQYIKNHEKFNKALLSELTRPYISFTADTLAPSEDKLTGTLEVIIPPGLPAVMSDNGKPVFYNCNVQCIPKPQYANDNIVAKVLVTETAANFEDLVNIPLKDVFSGSQLGLHEYPLILPMKGYAGSYPQDRYTADVTLAVALPAGMTPNVDTGPYAQVKSFDGGTVANSYNVDVKPTPKSFQQLESNANDTFGVTISRDWYEQFFVITVALIPVLFALLFFHLLFISSSGHGIGRSFEHFTEALVVSILSVLPLRVVLVPGDISGLTRVDLVLGIGLVLIVAVAAGKYAREIWTGTQSPPEEDESEHAGRAAFPDPDDAPPHSAAHEQPESGAAATLEAPPSPEPGPA